MAGQPRGRRERFAPASDEALLAALRDRGAHLSLPLRLLALTGALAFAILGLAGVLMPLREPLRPQPAQPPAPTTPQA